MQSRPLLTHFLSINNQDHTLENRLNHDAIALFIKHTLKVDREQTFALAGSEDLRALLPKLKLEENNDEAFLFIRPYIHSMAIYCRQINDRQHFYIFDSQSWGTRYYPTRLIIDAINQHYPNALILLSGTPLQSQDNQRGCTAYALYFLNYCKNNGNQFFDNITEMTRLDDYPNTFLHTDGNIPQELLATSMDVHPDWYVDYTNQMSDQIEEILRLYTSEQMLFDYGKINHAVKEMQGCYLVHNKVSSTNRLYEIGINSSRPCITFKFNNKDFIYANTIVHTNALYPFQVSSVIQTTGSNVSLPGKIISSPLLINHPDIRITYNERTLRLIYTADSFSLLEKAFASLESDIDNLYDSHIRQRSAINDFIQDVKVNCEFNKIKQNGTGGFDQHQVQLILAHLLEKHNDIYIPSISAIAGSEVLPLNSLHDQGYKFVAFSFQLTSDHQVAVWIELDEHSHRVKVYDSESAHSLTHSARTSLARLLNIKENQIEQVASPYLAQNDDWSCGVHAITTLSDNHKRARGAGVENEMSAASAANPAGTTSSITTSVAVDSPKPDLHVEKLGLEYYRYYLYQAKIKEKIEYAKHLNERRIQNLLNMIEEERFKQGFYSNTHTAPGDVLKPLADYLQMIVWGNLSRTASPSVNTDRARQSQSFMIQQTLDTLYKPFSTQSNEYQPFLNLLFELYIILIGDETSLNAPYFIDSLLHLHNNYIQECSRSAPSQKAAGRGYDISISTMDLPTAKLIIEQEITQFIQTIDNPTTAIRDVLSNVLINIVDKPLLACLSTTMQSNDLSQDECQDAINQYYVRMPMTHEYTLVCSALKYINHLYHSFENDKLVNDARIRAEQQAYLDAHQAEENEKNDFIAHMKNIGIDIPLSQTNNTASIKKMLRQAPAIKTYVNPVYFASLTTTQISQLLENIFDTKEEHDFNSFLRLHPNLNIKAYFDWFNNNVDHINASDEKFLAFIMSKIKDTDTYIRLLEHISQKSTSIKLTTNARTLLSVTHLIGNPIGYQALLSPTFIVNFMLHPVILDQLRSRKITFEMLATQTEERIALLLSANITPILNHSLTAHILSLPLQGLALIDSPYAKTIIEENLLPLFAIIRNPITAARFFNDEAIAFLRRKLFSDDIIELILSDSHPLDISSIDLIKYSPRLSHMLSIVFSAIDQIEFLLVDRNHTRELSFSHANTDRRLTFIKAILNNLKFISDYLPPCYFEVDNPFAVLQFTKKLNALKKSKPNETIGLAHAVELLSDDIHYTDKFVASFDVNNHDLLVDALGFLDNEQFISILKRIIELSTNPMYVQNATIILEHSNTDALDYSTKYIRQELLFQPHKKYALKFILLPNRRLYSRQYCDLSTLNSIDPETLELLSDTELDNIINRQPAFITDAIEMPIPMLRFYIALLLKKIDRNHPLLSDSNNINQTTTDGKTLLYYAVERRNIELSQMLLECGAATNIPLKDDVMPLIWRAIYTNRSDMIQLLLSHDTNINAIYRNQTPLSHAVEANNDKLCQLLIANGADVNYTCDDNPPLYRAVKNNNVKIAEMLLDAGAKIPSLKRNADSLLEIALYHQNKLLIKLLIIHGCDITEVAIRARSRGPSMWQAHYANERVAKSFENENRNNNCNQM